jgi:hypothetical protein
MLRLHHNPVQLYAPFRGSYVGFVATYSGKVGNGTKEGSSFIFMIYTEDKTVVDLITQDDFRITLDEPDRTYINYKADTLNETPDQIELLNSMYKAIREHYSN